MRFSSRLRWDFRPNALFRLLEEKRRDGTPLVDLTESNPTRAGFLYDESAILGALSDPEALLYRPEGAGMRTAREAVVCYYAGRNESTDAGRIVLAPGTSEAYAYLFKLLANPGDEILVPQPSYPLFEYLAELESVGVKSYPLEFDGAWRIDAEAVREAAGPRTKAVIVVNPNNPTGNYLKRGELAALTRICDECGLALICDEVFFDFALLPGAGASTVGNDGVLCFTLNGLSKMGGLPQMKLAWIVVDGPDRARRQAIERLELIADTYLSVATPAQCGAARLIGTRAAFHQQAMSRIERNLRFLRQALGGAHACAALPVEGGWYAVLRLPGTRGEEEWALTFLDRDNVLTQPGYFYDFTAGAHVVVSLIVPPDVFSEGIARMLARVVESVSSQRHSSEFR
ncbi:MAG: pyridoxal phosphate-dependent aminotransferase [Bryobacteraceae bacterium]|nr:pyridoxal phosphate-dependent aminotransferase [Bryobacteraceae bacterium]